MVAASDSKCSARLSLTRYSPVPWQQAADIRVNITVPKFIDRVVYSLSECTTPMAMMLLGALVQCQSVKLQQAEPKYNTAANSTPAIDLPIAMLLGFSA